MRGFCVLGPSVCDDDEKVKKIKIKILGLSTLPLACLYEASRRIIINKTENQERAGRGKVITQTSDPRARKIVFAQTEKSSRR